jgi:uncharacterized integral membrane protein (TIGR00697 family)
MNDLEASRRYEQIYVVFAALFIAALVSCNLIFKKFFSFPLGDVVTFQQSVGILPYPLTFLVTDILSEVYGRRRANQVVTAGFFASIFVVFILALGDWAPAAPWSRPANGGVDDATFRLVFGQAWVPITASMVAYLVAQYLDIRMFHFWRRLTGGRHLWLRNNASTICSQVVDTGLVLCLLAALEGGVTWEQVPDLFLNGVLFKVLCALLDTPLFYAAVIWFRRRFPEHIAAAHLDDGVRERGILGGVVKGGSPLP